jgi:hypothetical protein
MNHRRPVMNVAQNDTGIRGGDRNIRAAKMCDALASPTQQEIPT